MNSKQAIVVDDVVFEYPGKRALDGVSFSLPEHSITALVGPNGAGKSTLLRCLAALEQPLYGKVVIDGVDAFTHPQQCHEKIGYLSDSFGLYNELTVFQCLQFVATSYQLSNVKAAIDYVAALLNLEPYLDKKTSTLSRGWRQRVGIAQAIIHQPKVLLLDEPASGLDPEARIELATLLRTLKERGLTIIVSSHILAELDAYSTHMMVLENGKMLGVRPLRLEPEQSVLEFNLELVEECAYLASVLASEPALEIKILDKLRVSGIFHGNKQQAAALLKRLLQAGLSIVVFDVGSPNTQQLYLDTVQRERQLYENH